MFFGVQMGTLFLFTNQNAQGLQYRAAYFAFTLAFYYWTSLEALPIFLAEREIFQREFSRGAYRAAAYTISSSVVYFPFLFALGLVYTAISWWLVGLPNQASAFFFQVLVVWIVTVAGHTFSTMISVLVPDPMAGKLCYFPLLVSMYTMVYASHSHSIMFDAFSSSAARSNCGFCAVLGHVLVLGFLHQ